MSTRVPVPTIVGIEIHAVLVVVDVHFEHDVTAVELGAVSILFHIILAFQIRFYLFDYGLFCYYFAIPAMIAFDSCF